MQRVRTRCIMAGMTTDELLASLTASHTTNDEGLTTDDGYLDWSSVDDRSGRRCLEVSADGDTATIWLSPEDFAELHRRMTITLLAHRK